MGFVSLHNHGDYSLLDGASQISKMVDRPLILEWILLLLPIMVLCMEFLI